MKKTFLCGIFVCLSVVAFGQRSMDWYSYWGSNISGSQIAPQRMAVDQNGDIYVAAVFGGDRVSVESTTLVSQSSQDKGDAVIVKMSPAKVVQWTYMVTNTGSSNIADIAVDKNGDIYVVGAFTGSIRVGSNNMYLDDSNMGEAAIYLLKLGPSGNALSAMQIPALGAKAGGVAIDSQNNVIVTGILDGDATFVGGGEPEGDFQNTAQLFVIKLDENINTIWYKFRNDEGASVYGRPYVAVDAQDNIYIASTLNGSTTLAGTPVSCTVNNAFLLAMDGQGNERWYHMIEGDESDAAAGVAVSPIGEVALALNHHSGDLRIDDLADVFNNGYAFSSAYDHTAVFSFNLNGDFKWFYDWGYSNGDTGSDAVCYALRCTDEGVWYLTGMCTGRYGGSRLDAEERTLLPGKNSGVETADHQWIQHNTNGGHDCYLITLTRDGKLANAIRPGGPQYEDGMDVALSPDKKSLYLLMECNVRDNVPYTCPDNIFDSWTDLYAPTNWASRKANYTLLNVYCPENDGSANTYGKDYKGIFASSLLVKYSMPEINPNNLPYFTIGEPYAATIAIANPQGQVTMFPLGASGDVNFDGTNISGTFDSETPRYAGVLAVDSIALPGDITYYEYDDMQEGHGHHRSIRSNPRTVRYMAINVKPADPEEALEMTTLDAMVYPTLVSDNIYIRCSEEQYTVNMYTTDGRMIFSHDNVAAITVGGLLPHGQYIVEVRSGNKRNVTNVIVK